MSDDESFKNAMIALILHVDSMELNDGTYMRVAHALKGIYDKIGVEEEPSILDAEEEQSEEQSEEESEYEIAKTAIMHDNVDTMNLILQRNTEFITGCYAEFMSIAIGYGSINCARSLIELHSSAR
jgi:tetrahydromethanopterin S-methyltransferase subunit A